MFFKEVWALDLHMKAAANGARQWPWRVSVRGGGGGGGGSRAQVAAAAVSQASTS